MRYVIIGAGAIGGTLAGRLAQHGVAHPPVLVARGENGARIAADGIRLRTPDEDLQIDLDVVSGPEGAALEPDDVLVLATKSQDALSAITAWADQPVAGGGTASERLPILLALNGIASEQMALRFFDRVFGVCVWLPAIHLTPGEVIVRSAPISGVFTVGRCPGPAKPSDRDLLPVVAEDWETAGFRVHLSDDVMRWKSAKLLGNLGNALQALIGPSEAHRTDLYDRLRAEAEEVFRRTGVDWIDPEEEKRQRGDDVTVRPVPGTRGELGGSSWQSLARAAGTIETDYLNGEIAYLARSHGLQAPLNAALQRVARRAARQRLSPGSMTGEELAAQLGL